MDKEILITGLGWNSGAQGKHEQKIKADQFFIRDLCTFHR